MTAVETLRAMAREHPLVQTVEFMEAVGRVEPFDALVCYCDHLGTPHHIRRFSATSMEDAAEKCLDALAVWGITPAPPEDAVAVLRAAWPEELPEINHWTGDPRGLWAAVDNDGDYYRARTAEALLAKLRENGVLPERGA